MKTKKRRLYMLLAGVKWITISSFGMFGGMAVVVLHNMLGHGREFEGTPPASDVMAIANTYIVYTTLILVIIAIITTLAGVWFAKWFSITKEREIRESMRDFFTEIDSNSKLSARFVKELFNHKSLTDELHRLVQIRVEDELKGKHKRDGNKTTISDGISEDE